MGEIELSKKQRKIEMMSAMGKDRPMFYDKAGQPMTIEEYSRIAADPEYKRIGAHTVGTYTLVSTVWLGVDHSFGFDGPPVIFETMVFQNTDEDTELDHAQFRYGVESAARVGHLEVVDHVAAWLKNRGENAEIRQCDETEMRRPPTVIEVSGVVSDKDS